MYATCLILTATLSAVSPAAPPVSPPAPPPCCFESRTVNVVTNFDRAYRNDLEATPRAGWGAPCEVYYVTARRRTSARLAGRGSRASGADAAFLLAIAVIGVLAVVFVRALALTP